MTRLNHLFSFLVYYLQFNDELLVRVGVPMTRGVYSVGTAMSYIRTDRAYLHTKMNKHHTQLSAVAQLHLTLASTPHCILIHSKR